MRLRRRATAAAALAVIALAGTACSSSGGSGGSGGISLVASTNVWGDVAKQIAGSLAGSRVKITSIISDPDADPHSYEANTRNQLEISRAAVIVENGGGYDDFVDTMRKSAGSHATVLNAVELSGKKAPAGGDLNEHVWYDFPTVRIVADQLAAALAAKDRLDAATFQANAIAFDRRLAQLETVEAQIKSADAGEGAAITEPVPVYMLTACGLVNRTPQEFSEAIENGTDVSPRVLQQTLALFSGRQVKLLAYNEQTSGPQTEAVLNAAKAHGIAVVPVTETLPAGQDYLSWMTANLNAIKAAAAHT